MAIDAAFRGTLDKHLRKVWGSLFWSWGTETVPMCPQCSNSSGSGGSHSSAGKQMPVSSSAVWVGTGKSWQQNPTGMQLKSPTSDERPWAVSMPVHTSFPREQLLHKGSGRGVSEPVTALPRLILLAESLRVISDTGLIAFPYCAISEHPAQQP